MSKLDFPNSGGADIKFGGESGTCGRCADLQAKVERLTEERDEARRWAVAAFTRFWEAVHSYEAMRHDWWVEHQERDEANRQLAAVVEALKELVQATGGGDFCNHCLRAHSNMGSAEEMHESWCKVLAARTLLANLPAAAKEIGAKLELHKDHVLRRVEPQSSGLQQLGVHLLECVTCERALARALALREIREDAKRHPTGGHGLAIAIADTALREEGK